MNDDAPILVLCILGLFVFLFCSYATYKSYDFQKYAIDHGYEQVLVPCKTEPIWVKKEVKTNE